VNGEFSQNAVRDPWRSTAGLSGANIPIKPINYIRRISVTINQRFERSDYNGYQNI